MKHRTMFLVSSVLALFPCAAIGQTSHLDAANAFPGGVAAARCQYTQAEEACRILRTSGTTPPAESQSTETSPQAQISRPIPRPPLYRPPAGSYRYGYPGMWASDDNRVHTAVGALLGIGAGVGLAFGAYSDSNKRVVGSLIFGGFGALIGAGIGHRISAFHSYHRRRPWDGEFDQDATSRKQRQTSAGPAVGN
jgi:hypothetical protein